MQRKKIVSKVRQVVRHIWAGATVEVFGSYATGLYLPSSDIDMVVLNPEPLRTVTWQNQLAKSLMEEMQIDHLELIAKATVPILKF